MTSTTRKGIGKVVSEVVLSPETAQQLGEALLSHVKVAVSFKDDSEVAVRFTVAQNGITCSDVFLT